MIFGLLKKTDPICGMKEEKGKGYVDVKTKNWFCSEHCRDEFVSHMKNSEKKMHNGCCR